MRRALVAALLCVALLAPLHAQDLTCYCGDLCTATTVPTGCSLSVTGSGTIAATTSVALSLNPTDCLANTFANAIAANGNLTCTTVTLGADTTGPYAGSTTEGGFLRVGANTDVDTTILSVDTLATPEPLCVWDEGPLNSACIGSGNPVPCCTGAGTGTCDNLDAFSCNKKIKTTAPSMIVDRPGGSGLQEFWNSGTPYMDVRTGTGTGVWKSTDPGGTNSAFGQDTAMTMSGTHALLPNGIIFGAGGMISEGPTPDAFEGFFTFPDWSGSTKTVAFANRGGTVALSGDTLIGDVGATIQNTGITTTVIGADKVLESMLKAVDSPADEECLTYEATVGDFEWQACGSGGGSGTVTSVDLAVPAEWTVSGNPITGAGTITITEATQTANTVYAGPASGGAAAPGFRAIVDADIPAAIARDSEVPSLETDPGVPLLALGDLGDLCSALQSTRRNSGDTANECYTDDDLPEDVDYSNLTGGVGITNSPTGTINTASDEAGFLAAGTLACGIGTAGKMQIQAGFPLQWCDSQGVPVLQRAAFGDTGGAALTGDSATGFFGGGLLSVALGGTGGSPAGGDFVPVSDSSTTATWRSVADSDLPTQKLQYDQGTNTFSAGTDDDIPDAGDFTNLALSGDVSSIALATTIGADKVLEPMLKAVNAPTDEYALTYESTTGDFEWQPQASTPNVFVWCIILNGPDPVDNYDQVWLTLSARTITKVWSITDQGTVSLNLEEHAGTGALQNDILSADLVADTGRQTSCTGGTCDVNTISDGSLDAEDWVGIDPFATSGSPSRVTVCASGTIP